MRPKFRGETSAGRPLTLAQRNVYTLQAAIAARELVRCPRCYVRTMPQDVDGHRARCGGVPLFYPSRKRIRKP